MATRRWCGRGDPVSQVTTMTVGGTYADGQTYYVTINTRTVSYTSVTADASNSDAATGLQAALAASTYPEFREVTWTVSGAVVTGTAATPGKPFTAAATPSATGTGTLTAATPTASSGPNYWDVADNWVEGVVPTDGDDVTIDEGPSILYGLDASSDTLNSLRIGPNFPASSEIGLPNQTAPQNPAGGYVEYRDRKLKVGATTVRIDTVSRRVRLDLDTDATTVTVDGTGTAANAGEAALDIVGVNAGSVLRVNGGEVWVAAGAGDAATFPTVAVSDGGSSPARVRLGRGLTMTTLTQSAGDVTLECAATTVTKTGGRLNRCESGAVTTLRNRGGVVEDEGTGTITALYNSAEYRFRGQAAVTVTDCTAYKDSVTDDPNGRVTWTNPVQLFECHPGGPSSSRGPAPAYFNPGFHKKFTVAAI